MIAPPPIGKATPPDMIGNTPVPQPTPSGLTFTLVSEFGYGMTRDWKLIEHRFGDLATMGIQRYAVGPGARKFQFIKSSLSYADRTYLNDFFDSVQGAYQSFTYPAPNEDLSQMPAGKWPQGFTNYEVVFDTQPVSATELSNRVQTGLTFYEIISTASAPNYTVGGVYTRFPDDPMMQALAQQVQVIVPLVHIKLRNSTVPDIYFSDRRCNVTGFPGAPSPTTFLPRLMGIGEPGTADVMMSQSIDGRSDSVTFTIGNADRAMSQFVNTCSMEFAQIDLSLYHVNSGNLLQMWKGIVISWQVDGSPQMRLQCSDGLYPVTQAYPPRTVSRQCWKPFNQDIYPGYRPCPYSTASSGAQGGDPNSCDYGFNSPNGCLAHGMSNYFGGHPEQPQTVVIRDNGASSIWNEIQVAATSVLSDSIWGNPLQEIWCNSFGNPQRAFWAQCQIAAVRDESPYEDVLGIVGVGPLGQFEGMSVQTNADGYKFVVAPTADGFFPQGLKLDGNLNITDDRQLGLRQSVGYDPAHLGTAPTDGVDAFSLGQGSKTQVWTEYDPRFSNVPGLPNQILPYAAGTALCEIRYPKATGGGVTPTTAESHNMQVPIREGLGGTVFVSSGASAFAGGITNPFWVAANSYFRALGIQSASAATQLSTIVLSSLTNPQGTGAADIAGLWVDPIVGTSVPGTFMPAWAITAAGQALYGYNLDYFNDTFTWQTGGHGGTIQRITLAQAISDGYVIQVSTQEPQFMFQGAVGEFKPFRDWLTEILNCCLGYYCFEFGKLYMGIRYSAIPSDNFELGSMLFQSLSITPIASRFEYLKINFANVELQFQSDMAEYQDKDHAIYYGRGGAPLTSTMRAVGISTLSQGLRVAVTRVREEIGGILRPDVPSNPYIEWDNNKRVTFKTTLMALNTEVGQVIGVTHPDVPTYPGAAPGGRPDNNGPFPPHTWPFRIKKWMLHTDYSVTIVADSCVDSMYDLELGPQIQGVGPRPMPVLYYPEVLQQWAPFQVQADPKDALYPSEWTFGLTQAFAYSGDGSLLTYAIPSGALPVNQFIVDCGAPSIKKGGLSWAAGGSIPGGTTFYLQVCATVTASNGSVACSPPSQILVVQTPADSSLYSVTISNIQWPSFTGLTGWILFAGIQEDIICFQESDSPAGGVLPTSITYNGPLTRQTLAVPDFDLSILRLRATRLIHGGVVGADVQDINDTQIISWNTIDVAGTDDWSGRVLAIIGRQLPNGSPAPFVSFNIKLFDPATGTYTLDRDPIKAGVEIGDVFVVCTMGYDNSATPTIIQDPGFANANDVPPHTGETPHDPTRIGQMVRVIAGTSRGMSAKIVDNNITSYNLDRALVIDATSVWIVTDPGWQYSKDVVVNNADLSKTTMGEILIDNFLGSNLLVEGVTISSEGDIIDDTDACVRMMYIAGVQGTTNVTTLAPPLKRSTIQAK